MQRGDDAIRRQFNDEKMQCREDAIRRRCNEDYVGLMKMQWREDTNRCKVATRKMQVQYSIDYYSKTLEINCVFYSIRL